jgi:hypothetical protein
MKIKCPDCGSVISIERLRDERDFWQILGIYKSLSPVEAELVIEYVDCFRASAHAEMPTKKYLRILRETTDLLTGGQFRYGKYTYRVDREIALEAMQKTVDTEKRSFRNHNYWKVIMIGMLKKRGAIAERETEDRRREAAEERPPSEPERAGMPGWVKEKMGIE